MSDEIVDGLEDIATLPPKDRSRYQVLVLVLGHFFDNLNLAKTALPADEQLADFVTDARALYMKAIEHSLPDVSDIWLDDE